MKKARIEFKHYGHGPFSTWHWVLYDDNRKIVADGFWHHISKLAAKRAAIRTKKLMAEAEIKES